MDTATKIQLDVLRDSLERVRKQLDSDDCCINAREVAAAAANAVSALRDDPTMQDEIRTRLGFWKEICDSRGELAKAAHGAIRPLERLSKDSRQNPVLVDSLIRIAQSWNGRRPANWNGAWPPCPRSVAQWMECSEILNQVLGWELEGPARKSLRKWCDIINQTICKAKCLAVDEVCCLADPGLEAYLREASLVKSTITELVRAADVLGRLPDAQGGDTTSAPDATEQEPEGATGANSANNARLFPGGAPENTDIRDLVCLLDANNGLPEDERKSMNQVAREFTGEENRNARKAKSLLTRIRRMRREGKVNI